MEHFQVTKTCQVCGRVLIADISSIGTSHQSIMAITCALCAFKVGGRILKEDEVVQIEYGKPDPVIHM